jgi:L-alanine-DL-glutamate epimerase-like enolase superfamily enzyme
MRIVGVTVRALSVLRSYHTIVAAPARTVPPADAPPTRSHFLLLALHTDTGLTGLGEVSDYEPGAYDAATLRRELEGALRGVDPFDRERLDADVFPRYPGFGDALATAARAVENAPTIRPGLGTDRIALYAKLQTWTLKAASRRDA